MIKKFTKRIVKTYIMYKVGKWLNYEPVVLDRRVRRAYSKPFLRRVK